LARLGGAMNAAEDQPQAPQEGQPSEEELRARLEEELRKLRVQDVLLQSVVSIINLTSRRIAKDDEQDLEQARVGIDALRALVDLLDDEPAEQVRNAISDLQVHYARAAGGDAPEGAAEEPPQQEGAGGAPRKPPPGLWTPGSG
jgi:hypothetical protein